MAWKMYGAYFMYGELWALFLTVQARHEIVSRSWTNRRKYFFKQSLMKLWSSLLQDAMEAESINELKMWLDKFMDLPQSWLLNRRMWLQCLTREIFQQRLQEICKDVLRKEGRGFSALVKGIIFAPDFPLCMFSKQLKLDCLRHKILKNPLAWLTMTLHNSLFHFSFPCICLQFLWPSHWMN